DSLFIDHEGINAASAAVETETVGLSLGRIDAADFDEARGIRVQAEEAEAWTIPVAAVRRGDERRSLTGDRHVGAQVDIVEIAERLKAQQASGKVMDRDPRLLVRREDQAFRRVLRVAPDRRIVGAVA